MHILHIAGPDDVLEIADEVEALRQANEINKLYLQQRLKDGDNAPLLIATVLTKNEYYEATKEM